MATLPCFRCGKDLEPANGEMTHNQPYAGTIFRAKGQYGSTVFDPNVWGPAREFLDINICDECLLQNRAQVLHTVLPDDPPPAGTTATWEPDMTLEDWRAWIDQH